jgi:hypothetical protein
MELIGGKKKHYFYWHRFFSWKSKRYAQKSSGEFGAIPATYVELINNESSSTQQISNDNNGEIRTSSDTSDPSRVEEEQQQYMTSTPKNNSQLALSTLDQSNVNDVFFYISLFIRNFLAFNWAWIHSW